MVLQLLTQGFGFQGQWSAQTVLSQGLMSAGFSLSLRGCGGGKPADVIFKEKFRVFPMFDLLKIADNLLLLGGNAFNMS